MNKKGGVGKTTLSGLLADVLEAEGRNVTYLSVDPQGGGRESDDDVLPDSDCVVIDTPGHIDATSSQVISTADIVVIPTIPGRINEESTRETIELAARANPTAIRVILLNEYRRGRKSTARMRDRFTRDGGDEIIFYVPFSSGVQNADDNSMSILDVKTPTARAVVDSISSLAKVVGLVGRGASYLDVLTVAATSNAFVIRDMDGGE